MTKAVVTRAAIERVIKAAQETGVPVGRVEVTPDGTIIVHTSDTDVPVEQVNSWDTHL